MVKLIFYGDREPDETETRQLHVKVTVCGIYNLSVCDVSVDFLSLQGIIMRCRQHVKENLLVKHCAGQAAIWIPPAPHVEMFG